MKAPKIAKNSQNSLWLTNSGPLECAIFKTARLFENWPNFIKRIPKYIHRAGRLQPLSKLYDLYKFPKFSKSVVLNSLNYKKKCIVP